jgi:hypothetical protein
VLVPTSVLPAFTIVHVAISLAAILSGFVVLFGMIANERLEKWTAAYLVTTVLTSVTGFGFPITGVTPGLAFGVISVVVPAPVIYNIILLILHPPPDTQSRCTDCAPKLTGPHRNSHRTAHTWPAWSR